MSTERLRKWVGGGNADTANGRLEVGEGGLSPETAQLGPSREDHFLSAAALGYVDPPKPF